MNIVSAKCPNCGANIKVDENSNQTKCDFCASTILVEDAIEKYKIELFGEVKISGIKDEKDKKDIIEKYINVGEYENAVQLIQEVLKTNPFDEEFLYFYFFLKNIFISNKNEELINCTTVDERKKIQNLEFDTVIENRTEKIEKGDKLLKEFEKYKNNVKAYNELIEKKKIRKIMIKRIKDSTYRVQCWIDDKEVCKISRNGSFIYETLNEICVFRCCVIDGVFSNRSPRCIIDLSNGDRYVDIWENSVTKINITVKKLKKDGGFEIEKFDTIGHQEDSDIVKTIKWVLAAFCWYTGIFTLSKLASVDGKILHFFYSLLMIFAGGLACPEITKHTKKYEEYTKSKKVIVIMTTIFIIIVMMNLPTKSPNKKIESTELTNSTSTEVKKDTKKNTTKKESEKKKSKK